MAHEVRKVPARLFWAETPQEKAQLQTRSPHCQSVSSRNITIASSYLFYFRFIRGGAGSSTGGDRTRAGGVNPQQAIIGHLLSALAQRQSDRQGGFNPFAEILAMNPPGIFGPEGRHGDYAYTQEGEGAIFR